MADCIRNIILHRPHPVLAYLCAWLARSTTRLDRLFTLWQAGKLKPARPRPKSARKSTPSPNRIRLPKGRLWLIKHAQQTTIAHQQLTLLLLDPTFTQFATEVPAAQRILRPLCTATGTIPPAWLALPPRPRKPRPAKPARPQPRGAYPRFDIRTYSPGQAFLHDLKKKKSG